MKKMTMTTLGELRIEDRFIYKKGDSVWCVMAKPDKRGRVAVNQKEDANSKPLHKCDDLQRASRQVLFVRHGKPLPGEDCFVCDLNAGDTFFKPDDIIHEYVIQEPGHMFYKIRRVDLAAFEMAGKMATVVLVKRKEA